MRKYSIFLFLFGLLVYVWSGYTGELEHSGNITGSAGAHATDHSLGGTDPVTVTNLASGCTDAQVLGGTAAGTGVECQADAGGGLSEPLTLTDITNTFIGAIFRGPTADSADAGIVRLGNAESICWEASPAGTDVCATVTSAESLDLTTTTGLLVPDGATTEPTIEFTNGSGIYRAGGGMFGVDATGNRTVKFGLDSAPGVVAQSDGSIGFVSSATDANGTHDTRLTRAATGFIRFSEDGSVDGGVVYAPDARTIADTGDANPATLTLAPEGSYVPITCSDAHTCDITMSETGVFDGEVVTIVNVSTNVVDMADTAGVSEIAGAFAMGQYDNITLMYVTNTWVEIKRSDN